MDKYHKVASIILQKLKDAEAWHQTFEHEPAITSQDAASLRHGYTIEQGAKALIWRYKNQAGQQKFVLTVAQAHLKFDNKKIKKLLNTKDLSLATEQELGDVTIGVKRGGVPPWGSIFGLQTIADTKLTSLPKIVYNAGDRCFSIACNTTDYIKLENPQIADITI